MDNPQYIVNHVFMPLQLPQEDEQPNGDYSKDHALAKTIAEFALSFAHESASSQWPVVLDMLNGVADVHGPKDYTTETIVARFESMKPGDVTALLVRKQNAGIIIRVFDSTVVVEAFEASAPSERVMACENRLLWTFPGPSTSFPRTVFDNPTFREHLSSFIAQMNQDVLPGSAAHSRKAGSNLLEIRDTAHPRFITDLLMTILAATGGESNKIVDAACRVEKRIADDVLWSNASVPWRRSSLWLVIRVALQTTLTDIIEYKAFILFAMARITTTIVTKHPQLLDSTTLDNIRKKLARRAQKLDTLKADAHPSVFAYVTSACQSMQDLLARRWLAAQAADAPVYKMSWAPETLDLDADTYLRLTNSATYIQAALSERPQLSPSTFYDPHQFPRIRDSTLDHVIRNKTLESFVDRADPYTNLADFEDLVRDDLTSWADSNLADSTAPALLLAIIGTYYNTAYHRYNGNAEQKSLLIIVLLELWVALDRIAIAQCPLISKYPPEVPHSLLEPLLVRRKDELARVKSLSQYLRNRWATGDGRPSVFSDPTQQSFASRYYNETPDFACKRRAIEERARKEREAKVAELGRKNVEYEKLQKDFDHESHSTNYYGHCNSYCTKCSLSRSMRNLTIEMHEWPLPSSELQLQVMIFELYCPGPFSFWREATYQILHDIFTDRNEQRSDAYEHLGSYAKVHISSFETQTRISLASSTKSFLNTHYRTQHIPSTVDKVCLDHGPHWCLYDSLKSTYIGSTLSAHDADVSAWCTQKLPSNPSTYQGLQWTVDGTTHTENQVLVSQHTCHQDLSLHEFIAFGCLRAGSSVQWMNVAKALASRTLTLRSQEVHTLISQAVQQHGPFAKDPSCDTLWHVELQCQGFRDTLFSVIADALDSFQDNWQEIASVRTIILVTVRILASLPPTEKHFVEAHDILSRCRKISYGWLQTMLSSLERTSQEHIESAKANIREVAGTCALSFDTEQADLGVDNVAILMHCSFVLQDNREARRDRTSSSTSRILLDRVERMFQRTELRLVAAVVADQHGLNTAIRCIWGAYKDGTAWMAMPNSNERWLVCQTATSQHVQVNLLDGTLLVDGKPIGNLPSDVTGHSTYQRIFGNTVLRAIPAGEAGLDYKTVVNVSEHEVFFSLRGKDLVVQAWTRAVNGQETRLQYIPHSKFLGDIPTPLVNGQGHWLDLATQTVEIRPLESLWVTSPRNWCLDFRGQIMLGARGQKKLLDPASSTFNMIAMRLKPIEDPSFFVMSALDSVIDIQLPRFQLDFQTKVNTSNSIPLRCLTYPDTFVDPDQSFGTLVGLKSRLVLRSLAGDDMLHPKRRVLIPYGRTSAVGCGDHVRLSIIAKLPCQYTVYTINEQLGMLVDDGTLRSNLYKVLLHALTGFPLTDPLTSHTGTEEALNLLGSASCTSFQSLKPNEVSLLRKIMSLTPQRQFYPPGMKVMQTVHWSQETPACSQLTAFAFLATRILRFNQQLAELFAYPSTHPDCIETELSRRATAQESRFPLINLHDLELSEAYPDTEYVSRAVNVKAEKEACHYPTALMVDLLDASRFPRPSSRMSLYEIFENGKEVVLRATADPPFRYSSPWLSKSDFNKSWTDLYEWCRTPSHPRISLLFSLTAFAFGQSPESVHVRLLPYFVSIAAHSRRINFPRLPIRETYDLPVGRSPSQASVKCIIDCHKRAMHDTPSFNIAGHRYEDFTALHWRRECHYRTKIAALSNSLLSFLMGQWDRNVYPTQLPQPHDDDYRSYFDLDDILKEVCQLYQKSRSNIELYEFAESIDRLAPGVSSGSLPAFPSQAPSDVLCQPNHNTVHLPFVLSHLSTLLQSRPPPELEQILIVTPPTLLNDSGAAGTGDPVGALHGLLKKVAAGPTEFQRLYAANVRSSLEHYQQVGSRIHALHQQTLESDIHSHHAKCAGRLTQILNTLESTLKPTSSITRIMSSSGLWPNIGKRPLLFQMTKTRWGKLESTWRSALAVLSSAILDVQHADRLALLFGAERMDELKREAANCQPADPTLFLRHPDWALVQIESDFRARDIQIAVAKEMFSPESGKSISLQLNMGEGKSSVIAPMVAASLADGETLARMVVLKPLAQQMFQLLSERLCGLVNRRIFYLPFSRQVKVHGTQLSKIRSLYENCIENGGVLVVQPEHILSLKLLSIDQLVSTTSHQSTMLAALDLQRLLHRTSRDILDESDELLHPRYQLIYTIEQQESVEGHPRRWLVIQDVLRVVARHLRALIGTTSDSGEQFEVDVASDWAYPRFRFSPDRDSKVVSRLIENVINDIIDGALPSFVTTNLRASRIASIKRFLLSDARLSHDEALLQAEFTQLFPVLLILRGLLRHGILSYVLRERRWRVDYGLDASRTLLAVPYRAKDVPSPRAEFGHPDIAILLTCLAYYYSGLSQAQVTACLALLFADSNPAVLYETWVASIPLVSLPPGLRHVSGINMKDEEQLAKIFDLFHQCHAVIDFYLSNIVFPRAAKQFPKKLPTSAWDLAEQRDHVITGFSGTNDNRYLLPPWMSQVDPVNQAGTNAMVLTYLLQPENASYTCLLNDQTGKSMPGKAFIDMLASQHKDIRVLLDIGAQMLDMTNRAVAERWLSKRHGDDVEAAVFFDGGDELIVLKCDGTTEPLRSSPYRQRLCNCVVYLDDAHTRGTDLKLPRHWKAAVTLGRKVTKDRLVQGCMRMRQLGHGQSLHFFAPPDVDAMMKKKCGTNYISVPSIIEWTMLETCSDITHNAPRWLQQGIDFKQRRASLDTLPDVPGSEDIERVRTAWLQPEAIPLIELYGSPASVPQNIKPSSTAVDLQSHLQALGITAMVSQNFDEEQEREVDHEREQEQQIERPKPISAALHCLHDDIRAFVDTGRLPSSSDVFCSPQRLLLSLSRSKAHSYDYFHPNFVITTDYAVTTVASSQSPDFFKDVQWLLCAKDIMVVISQFEANELIPLLRGPSPSRTVRLHVYSPRVTRNMRVFDDLAFYQVPSLPRESTVASLRPLITQLNLFSGQLYPTAFVDFQELTAFLGVADDGYTRYIRDADGFVVFENRGGAMSECPFVVSPIALLEELISVRRRKQDCKLTPMGKMVRGLRLTKEDIEGMGCQDVGCSIPFPFR